jgi:hypothetical protein
MIHKTSHRNKQFLHLYKLPCSNNIYKITLFPLSTPQSLEVSKIKKNKKTSKNFGHKFFEVFLFFFIFETSSDCGPLPHQ